MSRASAVVVATFPMMEPHEVLMRIYATAGQRHLFDSDAELCESVLALARMADKQSPSTTLDRVRSFARAAVVEKTTDPAAALRVIRDVCANYFRPAN